MQIRPATPVDVPAILPLVGKVASFHENLDSAKFGYLENVQERYRSWLHDRATDPRSVLLVAEHENAIVGFIVATVEREIPVYRLAEFGFIHDLWVDQTYRNEGLGRRLVTTVVETFRGMGVKQVRGDTAAANTAAAALLAACGFRPSTIEMLIELADAEAN